MKPFFIMILLFGMMFSPATYGSQPELYTVYLQKDFFESMNQAKNSKGFEPNWYQAESKTIQDKFGHMRNLEGNEELPEKRSIYRAWLYSAVAAMGPVIASNLINRFGNNPDLVQRLSTFGLTIGPSAGVFYGDSWTRALLGITIRSISWLGARLFTIAAVYGGEENAGTIANWSAGILVASGIFDTFISTTIAVRNFNEWLEEQQRVSFYPFLDTSSGAAGIAARFSF